MVTMEQNFINRKQSLEEEISLCELLLSFEHRVDMRQKIGKYLDIVREELLNFLR